MTETKGVSMQTINEALVELRERWPGVEWTKRGNDELGEIRGRVGMSTLMLVETLSDSEGWTACGGERIRGGEYGATASEAVAKVIASHPLQAFLPSKPQGETVEVRGWVGIHRNGKDWKIHSFSTDTSEESRADCLMGDGSTAHRFILHVPRPTEPEVLIGEVVDECA